MQEISDALGLDQKESEIFLALCRINKGSVKDVMKKTNIERRTIYDVLDRLIQKGYASQITENNIRVFIATDAQIILEDLKRKAETFQNILPNIQKQKEETEISIFKGKKGIKTIFNEILSSKHTHYAFGDVSRFVEKAGIDTRQFLGKLDSMNVKEKIIYPKGKDILKIRKGEYKIIEQSLMPPTPVLIYGDVTAVFIFSNPINVLRVENKEITQSYMKYFETYWKMAKKA